MRKLGQRFGTHQREWIILAAYVVLLALMLVARPAFFGPQLIDTWVSAGPVLVVAVGMTLVIVTRQIDISVGSQFSLCAVLAAVACRAGVPVPISAAIAVLCGLAIGCFQGLAVAYLKLPSIVVTLAMMVLLKETVAWWREGAAVRPMPAGWQWFGASQAVGETLLVAAGLVVAAIAAWVTRYLPLGRAPFAVGSDAEAARLAGLRPARVTFWVFALTGALTGLGAVLAAVRQPQVATNLGTDLELKVIAAAVVGGTALAGGRGTVAGTLCGVALLSTIRPALSALDLPPEWEKAVQGAIILLAVGSEGLLKLARPGSGIQPPRPAGSTMQTCS